MSGARSHYAKMTTADLAAHAMAVGTPLLDELADRLDKLDTALSWMCSDVAQGVSPDGCLVTLVIEEVQEAGRPTLVPAATETILVPEEHRQALSGWPGA